MIEINQLAKKFVVENPKKLSEQERLDPRLKGKFFHSVCDVSFRCSGGEVLGLLGPNGAGKTTTLRMLSTALKPDAGGITINGVDALTQPVAARKKIGFLSGNTGLYGRLTGRENMAYFGQLHGMEKQEILRRIDALSELLGLHSYLDRRCESYSTGMKQKTAIARSVIHDPEVVILDEPTTGLDIMASQTVIDFIRQMKTQGVGVIFSTHHLDEVAQLSDRVAVINEGRTAFNDSLAAFCARAPESLNRAFLSTLEHGGQ